MGGGAKCRPFFLSPVLDKEIGKGLQPTKRTGSSCALGWAGRQSLTGCLCLPKYCVGGGRRIEEASDYIDCGWQKLFKCYISARITG